MAKPSRLPANYERNVFINCPFDDEYKPLFYAIVFAVNDLRFQAKCAKDESNAGKARIEKIQDLIAECKRLDSQESNSIGVSWEQVRTNYR